jgi:hypothetical protein
MNVTDSGTPVTSSDWDHSEFGINQGSFDGDLDFLADFDSDTDVSVSVTDGADSLESCSLTGLGLFLNRKDGHDVIEQDFLKWLLVLVLEKDINDLSFLDWNRSGVDFLEGLDFSHDNKSAQLGKWRPFTIFTSSSEAASTSATSSSTASITASASAESTAAITIASASAESTAATTIATTIATTTLTAFSGCGTGTSISSWWCLSCCSSFHVDV